MPAKRVFVASMGTESNTFSPVFAGLKDFHDSFYHPAGQHPNSPSLISGPYLAMRKVCAERHWELVEGSAAWAEPAGVLRHGAYVQLRDEILDQLQSCLPVDAVVLGLHGAMVTQESDDPEGELIEAIRDVSGSDTCIAASFDPHSHLSERRMNNLDLLVAFREYPHTDFLECAHRLGELVASQLEDRIEPDMAAFDCRMLDVMPTDKEPMRSFVDRIKQQEEDDPDILDISVIHGFIAGDTPDTGAKVVVTCNRNLAKAQELSERLGMELFSLRGNLRMQITDACDALYTATTQEDDKVTVIADVWDNPGGGASGDDTRMLAELIRLRCDKAALGPLWDPQAVEQCFNAGLGAKVALRVGAKLGPGCGEPIDAYGEVEAMEPHAHQTFGASDVKMGRTAVFRTSGVSVVLTSSRAQAFASDLFTNLGIDLEACQVVVVKSTNHFQASFAKLTDRIVHAAWPEQPYPADPAKARYVKLTRPVWPLVDNPFEKR